MSDQFSANHPDIIDHYTVKPGDTLSAIALNYYGSARREFWRAIYEANAAAIGDNPALIRPGQVLDIPQFGAPQPTGRILTTHTVKPGETLSHVALRYYGSAVRELWTPIYDANRKTIGNDPGLIRPGQVLDIPDITDRAWRMKSHQPMTLTLRNETPLHLVVLWVDYDGREVERVTLAPGEITHQQTFVTHQWTVRESLSKREILTTIATRQRRDLAITPQMVVPRPDPAQSTAFLCLNSAPFAVKVLQRQADGTETEVRRLAVGESYVQQAAMGSVWVMREANRESLVGMFLPTRDIRVEFTPYVPEFEGNPATTLILNNESLADVDVYWFYDQQEHFYRTLKPQDIFHQATFLQQHWILRESHSQAELMRVQVKNPQQRLEIHNAQLVSRPTSQAIDHLRVVNDSAFTLQLVRVAADGKRENLFECIVPGEEITYTQAPDEDDSVFHAGDVLLALERATQQPLQIFFLDDQAQQTLTVRPVSVMSHERSMVTFINQIDLTVDVVWLSPAGEWRTIKQLNPGGQVSLPSHAGNFWLVRDRQSGQIIEMLYSSTQAQTCTIGATHIRGLHRLQPAAVTLVNKTDFYLYANVIDEDGERHPVYEDDAQTQRLLLNPDQEFVFDSFMTFAVEVVEPYANAVLQRYIINPQNRFEIDLLTGDPKKSVEVTVINETGLNLEVIGFSQYDMNVEPLNPLESVTNFYNRYATVMVRDAHSQQMLAFDLTGDMPSTIRINSDWLRSLEEEFPVEVEFFNDTALTLDIQWINHASEDEPLGTLKPGERATINTYATHPFRITEVHSGEEISLFIPSDAASQKCVIEDNFIRRQERPNGVLWDGEVALYQKEEFGGDVWILRNSLSQFSEALGLNDVIKSLRVGSGTGVTLYTDEHFGGQAADFFMDTATLLGTKLVDKQGFSAVSSMRVWRIIPTEYLDISAKTGLRKNYRTTPNGLQEYNAYRCIVTFPPEVRSVDVWASEAVTIEGNGWQKQVDNATPARFSLDGSNRLVMNIEVDQLGAPLLKLRTNMMQYHERFLVFPDAEAHTKLANLQPSALWNDREKLGITTDEASCNAMQSAIKNLSSSVAYTAEAAKVTEDKQLAGDRMEYRRWMVQIGAARPDDAPAYRPLSREEVENLTAKAQLVGQDASAWFWDDVVDWVEGAADTIYTEVIVPVYDHVIEPIVEETVDIFEEAAKFGAEAVQFVEQLGEQGFELVKQLGEAGIRALGEMGQAAIDAVIDLGEKGIKALEKAGESLFETLVDLGEKGLALLEEIGEKGLAALESIGTATLEAIMTVGDTVKNTLVKLGEGLVNEINKAIVLTIEFAGKAYKFVLNTAKQVGEFVEKALAEIGAAIMQVIEWLDTFFNWGDMLDTHDQLIDMVNTGLRSLPAQLPAIKGVVIDSIDGVTGLAGAAIDDALDKLGVSQQIDKKEMEDNSGMDEAEWLMSLVTDALPDFPELPLLDNLSAEGKRLLSQLSTQSSGFMQSDLAIIEAVFGNIIGAVEAALANPAKTPELIASALLLIAKDLSALAVATVSGLIEVVIDFFGYIVQAILDLLNQPFNIPVLSEFYSLITDGRELTLLSLISLLIAAPTTIATKLIFGHQPHFGNMPAAQSFIDIPWEKVEKYSIATLYAMVHAVLTITEALDTGASAFGKNIKYLGFINWVIGLLGQFAGHPNGTWFHGDFWAVYPDDAPFAIIFDGNDQMQGDVDNVAKVIWLYQWVMLIWGAVALATSDETIKDKTKNKVTMSMGLIHLLMMVVQMGIDRGHLALTDTFEEDAFWRKHIGNMCDTVPAMSAGLGIAGGKATGSVQTLFVAAGHGAESGLVFTRIVNGEI